MASRRTGGDDPGPTAGYRAVLERYEDAPDQCTIFPDDTEPGERASKWITAESPGFVDLWEHR